MTAFWTSLVFVALAEMGDKTQLLAMAFAARYRASLVMGGVLAATLLNHLMAAALGGWLTRFVPMQSIQVVAAASFIIFGLWTIRGDELRGEDKRFSFSPFWTVAVAFFLAEMGDKTQLATVALSAKYRTLIPVWLGTTSGMMIADAVGIGAGLVLGRRIPERFVKWGAAAVFILFGLYGLHESLPAGFLTPSLEAAGLAAIVLAALLIARRGTGTGARQEPSINSGAGNM